jgi:hypothetical protein
MTQVNDNIEGACQIMAKHFDYATCVKEEDTNLYRFRFGIVPGPEYEWTILRPDWFNARLMAEAMWEKVYEDFFRRSRVQSV